MLPFKVRPESGRPFEPVDSWAPVPALALQAPTRRTASCCIRTCACRSGPLLALRSPEAHAFVPAGPIVAARADRRRYRQFMPPQRTQGGCDNR